MDGKREPVYILTLSSALDGQELLGVGTLDECRQWAQEYAGEDRLLKSSVNKEFDDELSITRWTPGRRPEWDSPEMFLDHLVEVYDRRGRLKQQGKAA